MNYLTCFLTILYGGIMGLAALAAHKTLPVWLVAANFLLGAGVVLAGLTDRPTIVTGFLLALLIVAAVNGMALHHRVDWSHWLVRFFLTILLIGLNLNF